jgi:hypothetical protein
MAVDPVPNRNTEILRALTRQDAEGLQSLLVENAKVRTST